MTIFEFISVMVSIVLGLSLARMLFGISQFAQNSRSITLYWPHVLWLLNLTLLHFLMWWSFWDYRNVDWNYGRFITIMLEPLAVFLITSIVIPNDFDRDDTNLRDYFHDVRQWFFISFLILECLFILDGPLVFQSEPVWIIYRVPQLTIVVVFLLALLNRRDWAQHVSAWTVLAIMLWSSGVRFWPAAFE